MKEAEYLTSRWRTALAVGAVPLFYTGWTVWAFETKFVPVPPLTWVLLLTALAAPVLLQPRLIARAFQSPLVAWLAVYVLVTALWFVAGSGDEPSVTRLRGRIFSMLFFAVLLVVYTDGRTHRPSRIALAWAAVGGALLNLYDLSHPLAFSPDVGRAAGLYLNANGSGLALVIGMTVALDVVPVRWRGAFVAVVGAGVMSTQSRSAALCFVSTMFLSFLYGQIRLRSVALWFLVLLAAAVGAMWISGAMATLLRNVSPSQLGQLSRLTSASGAGVEGDYLSTQTRFEAAREAWDLFSEHPLLGAGLGSSGFKAHNTYVMLAAEHGLLGMFLFPGFIAALQMHKSATRGNPHLLLGLALLIAGAFSHNVLDDLPTLLCVALAGGLSLVPRAEGMPEPRSAPRDFRPFPLAPAESVPKHSQ